MNRPTMNTTGYQIRSGKDDVTQYDWRQYMDFKDKPAPPGKIHQTQTRWENVLAIHWDNCVTMSHSSKET